MRQTVTEPSFSVSESKAPEKKVLALCKMVEFSADFENPICVISCPGQVAAQVPCTWQKANLVRSKVVGSVDGILAQE